MSEEKPEITPDTAPEVTPQVAPNVPPPIVPQAQSSPIALGVCSIVFGVLCAIVGLILGIIGAVKYPSGSKGATLSYIGIGISIINWIICFCLNA